VPPPFGDEPTRQVDDSVLAALRQQQPAQQQPPPPSPPAAPRTAKPPPPPPPPPSFNDEPTRMATVDPRAYDPLGLENNFDEATSIASLDGLAAMERARHQGPNNDERTRAVNIRNDPSISDIDWDLD